MEQSKNQISSVTQQQRQAESISVDQSHSQWRSLSGFPQGKCLVGWEFENPNKEAQAAPAGHLSHTLESQMGRMNPAGWKAAQLWESIQQSREQD